MPSSQEFHQLIRSLILDGSVPPGAVLSAIELSNTHHVGRMQVYKVLNLLASEGLIRTLPNHGYIVRTVTMSEVQDVFFLREVLETEAAALAARHMSQQDINRLKSAENLYSGHSLIEGNQDFHMFIARSSGNRLLANFIEEILLLMQQILSLDPYTQVFDLQRHQEDLAIVAAIEAHDEDAAREAMRVHIRNTQKAIWQRS